MRSTSQTVLLRALLAAMIAAGRAAAAEEPATPEQLRALYVGQWKLTCHWTNDVKQLGVRPGESMGGYSGTAQIADRDGQLILEILGEERIGTPWEKELVLVPGTYRLALDPKKTRRRAGQTEYTRLDLMLSPDRTTLRGVASWTNGLAANRSNEGQLLRAHPPTSFYPWGIGGSSLCLKRVGPPPESTVMRPAADEPRTILLDSLDPDSLADEEDVSATLEELAEWLSGLGYEVVRESGDEPPDFRGTLEVARFQPTISGQEAYLDTVSGQAVRFLKGTIPMGGAFTIKDGKGKRILLSVSIQRSRNSATPDDNPPTRVTPRGVVLLPPNMPADLRRVLSLLPGQAAALPPKQRRSDHISRLEELLLTGE